MTWLCVGDSITEKNFRSTKNYHDYVAKEYGLTVINEGFSGTGFVQDFEGNVSYAKRMKKYSPAPEIITIMGSFNDLSYQNEHGFQAQAEIRRSMDEYLCKTIEFYPLSFIMVISPPPRSDIYSPNWYISDLQEVCKKYALPFLNIYTGTALRPYIEENNREYFSCPLCPKGDGVHPNEKGHAIIAKRIGSALKEYIL